VDFRLKTTHPKGVSDWLYDYDSCSQRYAQSTAYWEILINSIIVLKR
jgi:hypothetical protein